VIGLEELRIDPGEAVISVSCAAYAAALGGFFSR
jgi:hypothetical protein